MKRHKAPRPWHMPSEHNLRETACGKQLSRVRCARDAAHWILMGTTHARRCPTCVDRSIGAQR